VAEGSEFNRHQRVSFHAASTHPGLPGIPFAAEGSPNITVPRGKTLVVETLSVHAEGQSNDDGMEASVAFQTRGVVVTLFLAPSSTVHYLNGEQHWAATIPAKLYVDGGSTISMSQLGIDRGTYLALTVSGYLV